MKFLLAVCASALVAAVSVTSASAYDRKPARLGGFTPDGWYQTVSNAETGLHYRYPGIGTVWCAGIIMRGYEADSSYLYGVSRAWDKFLCVGKTRRGSEYWLVHDQKGANSWIIYNLHGASIAELRSRY